MRAWQVHELGAPEDVLRLGEVDVPTTHPGMVRIRVEAAALNFPDVLMAKGEYQTKPPLPFIPGIEAAGEVLEVGDGVSGLSVGDRVFGSAVAPQGSFADETLLPGVVAFPIPEGMPVQKAAAWFISYQTAHVALHRRAALQPGETLLVHAAAGGVGSAAVQLGKAAGARVIATAGGAEKVQVARDLGADVGVDYTTEDFVEVVKRETDGKGADVVFDPVGGDVYDRSTKCVAFAGRILVIGFAAGRIPQALASHVLVKNYAVVGVHWGLYLAKQPEVVPETHAALVKLWQRGAVDPLVSSTFPFEEAPAALGALASRGTTGKVVLLP